MRHQKKRHMLGRTAAHRKATLAALASALIEHKRIETTLAKAKALRTYVEPLINRAKEDTTHNRREVFRHLQSKEAIKELFGDVAAQVGDRPGGYTRVVKLGLRQGDSAEMAVIELVDYNDVKPDGASGAKKRTRRSSGRRRSGAGERPQQAPAAKPATEKAPTAPASDEADDLTKIWGVGPVFAEALKGAGITTFAQLAEADLDTLRNAIAEGSSSTDASANEETWAEQARLAAAGDWDGHAAYVEQLKEAGATAHHADEDAVLPASSNPSGSAAGTLPEQPEEGEPTAKEPSTQSDDAPVAPSHPEEEHHSDAPQGAAPGTGEAPPEAGQDVRGRGGEHRG